MFLLHTGCTWTCERGGQDWCGRCGSISAGTGIAAKSRNFAVKHHTCACTCHVHVHAHVHVHVHVYGIFTDTTGRAAERFSNQDTKMVVSKVVNGIECFMA